MKQKKKQLHQNYRMYGKRFVVRFIVGLGIVLLFSFAVCLVDYYSGIMSILKNEQLNVYDMLYAQVSISFIVISLITILSDDTQTVYWKNLVKERLINPPWFSFVDITAYILAMVLLSTVFALIHSWLIIVPFVICLILLGVLTFNLTGSYFGKDEMKSAMKKSFLEMKNQERKEAENQIVEYTVAALERSDLSTVFDNIDFLVENDSGAEAEICFEVVVNKSKALMVNVIRSLGYKNICRHSFLRKKAVELIISLQRESGLYVTFLNLIEMYIQAPFLYVSELIEDKDYFYFCDFADILRSLSESSIKDAKYMIEYYNREYKSMAQNMKNAATRYKYPEFARYRLILLGMDEVCKWIHEHVKENGYNEVHDAIIREIFDIKMTVESAQCEQKSDDEYKKRIHRISYPKGSFDELKEIDVPEDDVFYRSTKKLIEQL